MKLFRFHSLITIGVFGLSMIACGPTNSGTTGGLNTPGGGTGTNNNGTISSIKIDTQCGLLPDKIDVGLCRVGGVLECKEQSIPKGKTTAVNVEAGEIYEVRGPDFYGSAVFVGCEAKAGDTVRISQDTVTFANIQVCRCQTIPGA